MKKITIFTDNVLVKIKEKKISKYIEVPSQTTPGLTEKKLTNVKSAEYVEVVEVGPDCLGKIQKGDRVIVPMSSLNNKDKIGDEMD